MLKQQLIVPKAPRRFCENTGVNAAASYYADLCEQMDSLNHAKLKYKYAHQRGWYREYFVDTAGKNDKIIIEYLIRVVLKHFEQALRNNAHPRRAPAH